MHLPFLAYGRFTLLDLFAAACTVVARSFVWLVWKGKPKARSWDLWRGEIYGASTENESRFQFEKKKMKVLVKQMNVQVYCTSFYRKFYRCHNAKRKKERKKERKKQVGPLPQDWISISNWCANRRKLPYNWCTVACTPTERVTVAQASNEVESELESLFIWHLCWKVGQSTGIAELNYSSNWCVRALLRTQGDIGSFKICKSKFLSLSQLLKNWV